MFLSFITLGILYLKYIILTSITFLVTLLTFVLFETETNNTTIDYIDVEWEEIKFIPNNQFPEEYSNSPEIIFAALLYHLKANKLGEEEGNNESL